MIDPDNPYTKMQREQYEREADMMDEQDHQSHNNNPEYWAKLLADVKDGQMRTKNGLDFGCGTGRNTRNLARLMDRVWGCDISAANLVHARRRASAEALDNIEYWQTNGIGLNTPDDNPSGDPYMANVFDFVMSTIVFQHIPVRDIRLAIWRHIHGAMKLDGIFSFQMGFGPPTGTKKMTPYMENNYAAMATNGHMDCYVENEDQVAEDLLEIGFSVVTVDFGRTWEDPGHSKWIYLRAVK